MKSNGTAKTTALVLPDCVRIQVAPGERIVDAPEKLVRTHGVIDWQPAGDGTFRPIVRLHEAMLRFKEASRLLGINEFALRRLYTAGFIEGTQTTPGTIMINLDSYYRHVDACKDPEFWSEKNRKRYSEAL